MNIILLSGGSGKRLWPLSNGVRSKQFLKIFTQGNKKESMLQRMYRMIKAIDSNANITIATSDTQISQIRTQIGENVNISVEPMQRDTFPAIVLAVAYIYERGISASEPVIVCPVDPYVDLEYFKCLKTLNDEIEKNASNLVLMGIEPTYPSEKYGYIIPRDKNQVSKVNSFKEKPDEQLAKDYIAKGALWNGGVFAFKIEYLLNIARRKLGISSYDELYEHYAELEKISFDYAVVEQEKDISVVRFNGSWKDLGTWNTLTEAMNELTSGNVVADKCTNTHIINELGVPLVAIGIENSIIAATPDGILVSDKEKSTGLKDLVTDARPMYEKRIWGEYRVLDYKKHSCRQSLVKELIIAPSQHISYQMHEHRIEMWTFTEGRGSLILDDTVTSVSRGDVVCIKPGVKHAIKAETELHIIEVQLGDELTEEDIKRFDLNWTMLAVGEYIK